MHFNNKDLAYIPKNLKGGTHQQDLKIRSKIHRERGRNLSVRIYTTKRQKSRVMMGAIII